MSTLKETGLMVFALVTVMAWQSAGATEVYRWTDADGVVHFSQTPPPLSADADKLVLHDPQPPGNDAVEDIYDVAGQQARMEALREERERKRQERIEQQREAESRQRAPYRQQDEYTYPGWWLRPDPPLRPLPPIERPPTGPGDPIRPPDMIRPPSPLTPRG